jgi:hypothetical protein
MPFETLIQMALMPGGILGAGSSEGVDSIVAQQMDADVQGALSSATQDNFTDSKASLVDLVKRRRTGVPARFEIWEMKTQGSGDDLVLSKTAVLVNGEPLEERRFIVTQATLSKRQRFALMQTFGEDPDFLMTFGPEPMMWNFGGYLRSEVGKGNWVRGFDEFYERHLRADRAIRRNRFAMFYIGNLVIEGQVLSLEKSIDANLDDAGVPFNFTMAVRSYRHVRDAAADYVALPDGNAAPDPFQDLTPLS